MKLKILKIFLKIFITIQIIFIILIFPMVVGLGFMFIINLVSLLPKVNYVDLLAFSYLFSSMITYILIDIYLKPLQIKLFKEIDNIK